MAKKKDSVSSVAEPVLAIKGFDKNLQCRGYQFEIGRIEKHGGKVEACESGFHAITGHPLAVFRYYAPGLSVYHRVELSGSMHTDDDEKTAAEILKVGAQIGMSDLVKEAVKWVTDRATVEEGGLPVLRAACLGRMAMHYSPSSVAIGMAMAIQSYQSPAA